MATTTRQNRPPRAIGARHAAQRLRRGVTLAEIVFILVICLVMAAILFPVFSKAHEHSGPSCHSRMRQIGLAMQQYATDYDDRFPIVGHSLQGPFWGGSEDAILAAYDGDQRLFVCPSVAHEKRKQRLTYMYNDLAAAERLSECTAQGRSVLVTENDDMAANFGHARQHVNLPPQPGVVNPRGVCDPGRGATAGAALTRHVGRANYLFVDGHVKTYPPDQVFFPSRESNSSSHKGRDGMVGPDPAGSMRFLGNTYQATLHVR